MTLNQYAVPAGLPAGWVAATPALDPILGPNWMPPAGWVAATPAADPILGPNWTPPANWVAATPMTVPTVGPNWVPPSAPAVTPSQQIGSPWNQAPPPAASGNVHVHDTTTNGDSDAPPGLYSGPVAGLASEYADITPDSVNLTAGMPNIFLKSGGGMDALQVSGGSNVLDGGTGSNFLVGATGTDGGHDTFFLDARNPGASVWSTIVNFHPGDAVTIWGFTGASTQVWQDMQGATNYQGATLHSETAGPGTGVNASVTFSGFSVTDMADASTNPAGKMLYTQGTAGGIPYLYITEVR